MLPVSLQERFCKPEGWLVGHFTTARNGRLHYGTLRPHKKPLAHILYVEGLREYTNQTYELSRNFNAMKCNFSVIDRHGQGLSTRYLSDPHKQHSQGVDRDIDDLVQYCRDHIPASEPVILLGYSTGGLIGSLALARENALFKGGILIAPPFGLKNPMIRGMERTFGKLPLPETLKTRYAPGGGPWKSPLHPEAPLHPEDHSSDPERNITDAYWTTHNPDLRTGDITIGWVWHICRAIDRIHTPAVQKNIRQPVLVFTGGQDLLVHNETTLGIVKTLPNAEHIHYATGKHDLPRETDAIRDDILKRTHFFLADTLGPCARLA